MVIVNGHGGNGDLVGVAATQLADHGVRAAALSYWELLGAELAALAPGDGGRIGHAGQTETSIQLFLQPGLVAQELATPDLCADLARARSVPFAAVRYRPPEPGREAPEGVYGDAPAGRRELGERVVELAAARLAEFVRRFAAEGEQARRPVEQRPDDAAGR